MHTVPGLRSWPPVPLHTRRPARRKSSIALLTEFTSAGATWRGVGRGPTASDAIFAAWSSIPTPGDWRLSRFFPVRGDAAG